MADFLDGYTYFDFEADPIYLRLFQGGVEFSEGVTKSLGFPNKCIILLHDEMKRCALQAVDLDDVRGVSYYEEDNMPPSPAITWKNERLAARLAQMGGLDLSKAEYTVHGFPLQDVDAVMFDMHTAKERAE